MKISRPRRHCVHAIVLGLAGSAAATYARAQCLQSDDFSGQYYGPQWNYLMQNISTPPYIANVRVPSTNQISGRYLVLGASPYASASDLWPDMPTPNYAASSLLQPVNPNADWIITTEIAAYMPPVYKSSAGLGAGNAIASPSPAAIRCGAWLSMAARRPQMGSLEATRSRGFLPPPGGW